MYLADFLQISGGQAACLNARLESLKSWTLIIHASEGASTQTEGQVQICSVDDLQTCHTLRKISLHQQCSTRYMGCVLQELLTILPEGTESRMRNKSELFIGLHAIIRLVY